MIEEKKLKPITSNMIRVRGTPKWVDFMTPVGPLRVQRRAYWTKIYLPEYELAASLGGAGLSYDSTEMVEVNVQDYAAHFICEIPKEYPFPSYMCSCGSPAVFVGSNMYKEGATPTGFRLVCLARHGTEDKRHADGVQ